MMLSSAQMSRAHELETLSPNLTVNGKRLERVSNFRLLGTQVNQNLNCRERAGRKLTRRSLAVSYATVAVIKKLKHLTPFHVRKQLAECLILSKIDYNDIVSHPVPGYLIMAPTTCPVGRYRFRSWALCACAGCNQTRMDTNERNEKRIIYRIYSINRPRRLLNFWTLRVGAYSRWVLIRGWALIKFSPFSASEVCLFCNKTINANNKTRKSNKARFL